MNLTSNQADLSGSVLIPSSKSHTVRALLFALLGEGRSTIHNPLSSGDTEAALSVVRGFGADITQDHGTWTVEGLGGIPKPPANVIDVLNSGPTLYIAMGIASLIDGHTVFTGDEQIRSRPAGNLMAALNGLGAESFSTRGTGCAP
ncbi:MAG: 3-phosphoshikimate 1-carboxyvinyltransferase, partial [Planctomycetota bacterium]